MNNICHCHHHRCYLIHIFPFARPLKETQSPEGVLRKKTTGCASGKGSKWYVPLLGVHNATTREEPILISLKFLVPHTEYKQVVRIRHLKCKYCCAWFLTTKVYSRFSILTLGLEIIIWVVWYKTALVLYRTHHRSIPYLTCAWTSTQTEFPGTTGNSISLQ